MSVFRAEVCKSAAEEHVVVAKESYDMGKYVLSCYVSGLSVECLLRGYRVLKDPEFDAKHDLKLLSKICGWSAYFPLISASKVDAAIRDIYGRLENAHRYRSTREYRRFLQHRGFHRGILGDFVKEQTRIAVRAAELLVRIGATSWPHD